LDEVLIFALLGQYHIKGKKDWAPFEQAGFLYRRSKAHDIDLAQLAQEIGLSKRKVEHLISVYQFMLDHGEAETARWSYYDEYLKSTAVRKARLGQPGFDGLVVEKIKSGEIARAVDVRDRLPVICLAPKTLQKFATRNLDFEDAHEHAVDSGADSTPYRKLAKFRQWLADPEVETALSRAQGETRKKIMFELDKLVGRVEAVRNKLKTKT
jgi:DNA-binding transcriptional ArsR family regulator